MPLKTEDLNTVENYKKAIKHEAGKIGAAGNIKFWIYKDVELPTAAGGKQKLPILISLVDDVAAKAVLKGKLPLCHGTCGLAENKIAFDAAQGKVPYALLIKSVPLLLGKMVHLPAGVDVESSGEEASPPPPPPPPPGAVPAPDRHAQLNAAWKQLSQQASQRLAANPAQRDALTKAMAGIPEMLQGGQLDEAQMRLEQLQTTLKATAAPSGTPYPGIVKYRAALLQFAQAKSEVHQQISRLASAIVERLPHETNFAKALAAEIEDLNNELAAAVDEAMKGAENEASPATDAIKLKIRKYTTELASNALIHRADSNPFGVTVTIGKTLGGALGRIRESMPV
jgi:hypothetical protein